VKRQENDAEHREAVFREADLDAEIAVFFYKTRGTVDRVDDPHAPAGEANFGLVRLFFGQYGVVWKRGPEPVNYDAAGLSVSNGHRFVSVVGPELLMGFKICSVVFEDQLAGDPRKRDRGFELMMQH